MRKCPGCGAMIESDDVAHFDVHGDLESRVAALEKKPDEAPTGGQEKPGGSRFSFRTLMDDMNEGGNDAQEGETEGP